MVQALECGDMKGSGDTNETPDRAEVGRAVTTIAKLHSRFGVDARV